jgi:hypothetical protein
MTAPLITLDRETFAVSVHPSAKALRTQAMMLAVEIESVTDADSQAKAVEAQKALAEYERLIEQARQTVKGPVLDLGRAIDKAAKDDLENIRTENVRVSRLLGDFAALELAKQRAAEAAQREELTRLERERAAELAKASTFEQREVVHERYAQEVDAACRAKPVQAAARVEGQIIKVEWEFEVTDARTLAQMHPHLVNIEPRRSEIKEALKLGACQECEGEGHRTIEGVPTTCPGCNGTRFRRPVMGVKATKVVKAGVRATKPRELSISAL